MYCKNCGSEIKEGNKFCTNCGKGIDEKETIKIKLSTFIILAILAGIIFIIILVLNIKNSKDTINIETNEQIANSNTNSIIQEKDTTEELNNNVETFGDTFDDTTHLLEQIYEKYPELEGKDGIICSNLDGEYPEYWLLDKNGKKMYFTNIEGFEALVKECPSAQIILNGSTNTSTSTSSNVANTKSYDETKRISPSLLRYKMEEDIKSLMATKNISYTIEYKEVTSYKDGEVYDYKIISNREKEKNYSYFDFQDGESLIIYISKYNDKTVNYEIDVASLIAEYTIKCKEKNLSMNTNNFTFELKINDNLLYSKTISNAEAKKAMKTDKKIEDYPELSGSAYYGNNYTKLNATYTGYGILNTKLYINNILIKNQDYNIYKEEYCDIFDNNSRSGFKIVKEGNDKNVIYMRFQGTLGFGGSG